MKGYRTLAFGLLVAIAPAALHYLAGVHWTDYVSPEWAGVIVGAIAIGLRVVTDTPMGSDVAKKLMLAGGLMLAWLASEDTISPARAQSTTTTTATTQPAVYKAPPAVGYPQKCGGYFGFDGQGGASTVSSAAPGTTVIGGDIGGLVGYACQVSSIPYFVEVIADFQNLNGSTNGFALTGPFHGAVRLGVQTPLMSYLSGLGLNLPTANTPVLPPGTTLNGSPQNYLYGQYNVDDISAQLAFSAGRVWMSSAEIGTGLLQPIKISSNGWNAVLDSSAGLTFANSELCFGGVSKCPQMNTGFKAALKLKF